MKTSILMLASFAFIIAGCGPASETSSSSVQSKKIIQAPSPAIKTVASAHDFAETRDRLEQAIGKRPLNLFAKIDHSAGAEKAGLSLSPSTLFIFGSPKGGTPLMQRNPQMGIVLPLKIHVFQDEESVKLSYTDIASEAKVHGLDITQQPIPNIITMLDGLAGEVIAP